MVISIRAIQHQIEDEDRRERERKESERREAELKAAEKKAAELKAAEQRAAEADRRLELAANQPDTPAAPQQQPVFNNTAVDDTRGILHFAKWLKS